jgi:hypothetical protein
VPSRTIVVSSFERYVAEFGGTSDWLVDERAERDLRKSRFPFSLMLELSFAELDFVNQWCWQQFGAADGQCLDKSSNDPICQIKEEHSHAGKWCWNWIEKTDYNFGFCEWYFSDQDDLSRFKALLPEICWGEKHP